MPAANTASANSVPTTIWPSTTSVQCGDSSTVPVNSWSIEPDRLVAAIVKANAPECDGMPVIAPVVSASDSPIGKVPAVTA